MNVRGVRWATIEEGDANAHEESDDDEAKTSAEGVNESEPVYPTLRRNRWHSEWSCGHREAGFCRGPSHTYISHQQETHQVEAEAQSAQEQGLVQRVRPELWKLVQHGCSDALHVAKL